MAVSEMQARMRGRIWQGIAQSGVNVAALPQAEMDKLVNAIADGILQEVDTILGEVSGKPASVTPEVATLAPGGAPTVAAGEATDASAESILWEGRPFLSLSTHYQITTERIRIVEGLMGKEREDVELIRVQDVDQTQRLSERMLGLGDIHIRSHDPSSPEVILNNIADVQAVHEILRRAVMEARKRHNLLYREQM